MQGAGLVKAYDRKQLNEDLAQVQKFLKDNGVTKAKISITSQYVCGDQAKTGSSLTKAKDVSCEVNIPFEEKAKANKLNQALAKLPQLHEIVKIKSSIGLGDKFVEIDGVDRPQADTDELSVQHVPGTVLLVDFWATWCGPCQAPMAHNQQMLEKNADKWKDKVIIAGLSLDQDRAALVKRIAERGWNKIDHYILPGNWKHPGPQMYGCQGIPQVVLVGKDGVIAYIGHPSSINLEAKINQLLEASTAQGAQGQQEGASADEGVPLEDYKKLRGFFKQDSEALISKINEQNGLLQSACILQHEKILDQDLNKVRAKRDKLLLGAVGTPGTAANLKQIIQNGTKSLPSEHIVERIHEKEAEQKGCTIM